MTLPRRRFLQQTLMAGGVSLAAPLDALAARLALGAPPTDTNGYGPLAPVKDEATGLELIQLPRGFRYISYGWIGDRMENGRRTPGLHDGMGALQGRGARVVLIRNHEIGAGTVFGDAPYDAGAGGGTTSLEFDTAAGTWVTARASLAGTFRNCAGGPTPWGSWLTCEEGLAEPAAGQPFQQKHGYVFEVPLEGATAPRPLVAMGRFVHEAVAVDPATGFVYETEDARSSGLYRFRPADRTDLSRGGTLEMLAVQGRPRFDTRTNVPPGPLSVSWVPIPDPDRAHARPEGRDGSGVFSQGLAAGGAIFARLEGAWFGDGKVFFTATSGGAANMGQVWELDPARSLLRLVFESPGADVLNMPDNIAVSPRGGLVLCEDGTANPCMHGLTRDGRIFRFARNQIVLDHGPNGISGDFRAAEFAGACFSPDGEWLFVNVQSPGLTLAITGPWGSGKL